MHPQRGIPGRRLPAEDFEYGSLAGTLEGTLKRTLNGSYLSSYWVALKVLYDFSD